MSDWTKDLPNPLIVLDDKGKEHTCSLRLVGQGWYGAKYRLEYYERSFLDDEVTIYLRASGDTEEEAVENMKAILDE